MKLRDPLEVARETQERLERDQKLFDELEAKVGTERALFISEFASVAVLANVYPQVQMPISRCAVVFSMIANLDIKLVGEWMNKFQENRMMLLSERPPADPSTLN